MTTSGMGMSGTGTGGTGNNQSTSLSNTQQGRSSYTPQQQRGAFVGADSSDTTNVRSLQGTNTPRANTNTGLQQLQNLFSQGLQNVNRNNQTASQVQIPVALKLGFTPLPVAPARVQVFQARLLRMPSVHFVGPPEVTMEGRTAVLRGKVATEEDRELAEALAKMEPDVLKVENQLVVDSSGTRAEELPPAPQPNSLRPSSP